MERAQLPSDDESQPNGLAGPVSSGESLVLALAMAAAGMIGYGLLGKSENGMNFGLLQRLILIASGATLAVVMALLLAMNETPK